MTIIDVIIVIASPAFWAWRSPTFGRVSVVIKIGDCRATLTPFVSLAITFTVSCLKSHISNLIITHQPDTYNTPQN